MLPSVRAPRVYHHIVAHIERALYDGQLACGDKLPSERELGRRFGASRVAVREALRALEHRGLLEVRQGSAGGHFVRAADASVVSRDFRTLLQLGRLTATQLAEARFIMEPEVARLEDSRFTRFGQTRAQRRVDPDKHDAELVRGRNRRYAQSRFVAA